MNLFCVHTCSDHYWVDYDGRIPDHAVLAGFNNNTKCKSYIGQGYVHNYGLLLGTINPGIGEIQIPCYGVKKTDIMIKILCAPNPLEYEWLPTTPATFKKDVEGEFPLLGGYDRKSRDEYGTSGILNIGRTREHGRAIIGNIAAYAGGDVPFYYPLNGTERNIPNYEVLVFRGTPVL
ncbi:hypothetical protein JTB14_025021 [Gonioctena quinquepunctata]|nr:hypothetical protein JTB14_025021 [Gonioctena quinquepunctata]